MKRLKVLIVDDSEIFLQTMVQVLSNNPAIEVVWCVKSGEAALELAESTNPDLVLMDIKMPGMSGLEAARRLKGAPGSPHVAIVTAHGNSTNRHAATEVGADDFINKTELAMILGRLISKVSNKRLGDETPRGHS